METPDFNNPLKAASFTELWDELCSRTDNCFLVFSKSEKIKGTVYCDIWQHASVSELLGLLQLAKLEIPRRVVQSLYCNNNNRV
jgi:hypothetical protein